MSVRDVASNAAPASNAGTTLSPQCGSVSLHDDADAQLGLRGTRTEIRTASDFLAHAASMTHEEREAAAHRLGLGKPRSAPAGRDLTDHDLGIPTDPETGKSIAPEDYADNDCDPSLFGKSPDEMAQILRARESGDYEGDSQAFFERLMQREVKLHGHGGGGRSSKKPRPKPTSIVDRTAAYASEKRLAS